MSTLIDLDNEPGNVEQLRKDLSEAVVAGNPPPKKAEPDPPEPKDVPEKYKGKGVDDVIDMHRNAESALGRASNELGQYKQLTDQLLNLKRQDDLLKGGASEADIEEEKLPEVSSTDLLDNPTEAVAKVVDARLTADARKRKKDDDDAAALEAQNRFADKHPDAAEIANNPEFVKWVQESPLRFRAAREAYEGDSIAGIELLDEYKASRSEASTEDDEANDDPNIAAARKAATVSAGASQTTDAPKGKIYRRLDLIRLKLEDPEAYADPGFQSEIMSAYNEGRVK